MCAKTGAKVFVGLYFATLIPMLAMAGGWGVSAFAAIPIISSAAAIVMAMLYFTIFFGHYEDHEEPAPEQKAVQTRQPAVHSAAHGY